MLQREVVLGSDCQLASHRAASSRPVVLPSALALTLGGLFVCPPSSTEYLATSLLTVSLKGVLFMGNVCGSPVLSLLFYVVADESML